MKEIFTDLYNKVMNFFQTGKEEEENTKDTACNRLKLVLMQDRVQMDPYIMQKMREEMIGILNKYLEIDNDALDLNLAGEGDSIALMFNIPVIRAKSNEEIEEYERELKEKLAQEAKEQSEETEVEEQETEEVSEEDEVSEDNEDEVQDSEETSDEEQVSDNEEEQTQNTEETEEVKEVEVVEEKTEETLKKDKKSSKKSEN